MSYSFSIFLRDYASSSMMRIANGVGNVQNRVNSMTASSVTATTRAAQGFDNLSNRINNTEREMNELGNESNSTNSKLSSIVGVASRLFFAFASFESVKALFNIGVEAEQANTKFEVLLGSVSKANKMLSELTTYADKTPYSFKGLQQGAETMLGFGIAEERILPSMKMLGDVAMGNNEKLGSLSLVYSQIMATGRLMGQDLLQLINSGFNPLQVISEQTGISMGDLKGKMEDGAISADMITEAFRIATSEGGRYYGMTDKMSETAGGRWSTMMDAFAGVTKKVGLRFADWIKPLFDIGTSVANNIIPFGKWLIGFLPSLETFRTILYILGITALAVGSYMLFVNASTIAWSISMAVLAADIWLAQSAQWAWNLAMSLNPIGLVIAAIVALIAVVVVLWNKFGWFRGAVLGVWEVLKGLGTMIKNYVINRFTELLNGITGIGKAFIAFIKGDFQGAIKEGANAGKNLLGVNSKAQALKDGKDAFLSFNKGWEEGNKSTTPKTVKSITKTAEVAKGKVPKSTLFDSLLGKEGKDSKAEKNKTPKAAKDKSSGIASGGSKQTHIVINIGKLNEKIEINTTNLKDGSEEIESRMQEILLRAVNSVNQMQTG